MSHSCSHLLVAGRYELYIALFDRIESAENR